ncbi:hypothetical protein HOLleu_14486 [Holothuria leucospilota]|uniref:Uncharacterized protein n=1 Tax=Holothuria leucospilota TaxID=206669 RepID=A0A9Q1C8R7_HOLLE|nr:hypothetical protein HOLleu_14486 [Holothuria leucospilota]
MSEDLTRFQSRAVDVAHTDSTEEIALLQGGEHRYKGYVFYKLQTPENLDALRTFEVRDDDVYCVTYPKSGKTINSILMIAHRHCTGVNKNES